MSTSRTILVTGDDPVARQGVLQALLAVGLSAVALEPSETGRWVEQQQPSLVVIDTPFGHPGASGVLPFMRGMAELASVPIVVISALASESEVRSLLSLGADEVLRAPFCAAELELRVRAQLRLRDATDRLLDREQHQGTVLELTQRLASTLDVRDILFLVVQRVAAITAVDRCSIVLFSESGNLGYVLATSDDPELRDLPIELSKYPEIQEVSSSGATLVIRNAAHHPLLDIVRRAQSVRGFNSLAIIPITHEQRPMGVLFLRAKGLAAFNDYELSLVQTVANATAIALRNARILQSLRDETELARVEAERRVQLFQRYADFFESAADGMIVIDRSGRILFANPRAHEITGFAEAELRDLKFVALFGPRDRAVAERLLRGFEDAIYPRGIDLSFAEPRNGDVVVSASFNPVLHEDDAILLTFRDVTVERRTAVELARTKNFLECVIESSVDGIVSANLRGTVLVFNRAAARIFGYSPEDVIGRMRVDTLYPSGVAHEIMRKIRDPALSGYGRLEDYRVDMLGADGRTIQVQLSASLVLDDGRPIGSVGIFTDIREKLRIQSELERAQDELRVREKQAILAELAGAAAHELNQPLTSVIGYAELLRRQLASSSEHLAALQIITDEAVRMAEIVRKVGRITRYETKSYVGAAKILDLERASEEAAEERRG